MATAIFVGSIIIASAINPEVFGDNSGIAGFVAIFICVSYDIWLAKKK